MIFYVLIINFANTQHYFTINFFDKKIFIKSFEKINLNDKEIEKNRKNKKSNFSENISNISSINHIWTIKIESNKNNNNLDGNLNYNNNKNFNFEKINEIEEENSEVKKFCIVNPHITKRRAFISNQFIPNLNNNINSSNFINN